MIYYMIILLEKIAKMFSEIWEGFWNAIDACSF
jgi:hypothetical protein